MRYTIQFLAGCAVICAIVISFLLSLSFWNRLAIYRTRAQYKPEVFVVTGDVYSRGDEGGDSWWLDGFVAGRAERLIPKWQGAQPRSVDVVRLRYPRDTKIRVLYNPAATTTIMQGETLRVIEDRPGLWEKEARLRRILGAIVLVPVPLTLAFYLAIRRKNRRCEESIRRQLPPPVWLDLPEPVPVVESFARWPSRPGR